VYDVFGGTMAVIRITPKDVVAIKELALNIFKEKAHVTGPEYALSEAYIRAILGRLHVTGRIEGYEVPEQSSDVGDLDNL